MLDNIFNRYNPENDTRPDGPPVTWAEYALANRIQQLEKRLEKLEDLHNEIPIERNDLAQKALPQLIRYKSQDASDPSADVMEFLSTYADIQHFDQYIQDMITNPDFTSLEFVVDLVKVSFKSEGTQEYLSFRELHGRDPIPGEDFPQDACLSQDDHEYLTGTGRYKNGN